MADWMEGTGCDREGATDHTNKNKRETQKTYKQKSLKDLARAKIATTGGEFGDLTVGGLHGGSAQLRP